LKNAIKKIREKLQNDPDSVFVKWYSSYVDKDAYIRLERTFLIVAACHNNVPAAYRFAFTLENNEFGHQRLLTEGETLVRIKNGRRCNLVVKPRQLRYNEKATPAGIHKVIAYGNKPDCFNHSRNGDADFLFQVEEMLFDTEIIPVVNIPLPEIYKKVRSLSQIGPRITGELIIEMKNTGEYNEAKSVADNFYDLSSRFSIQLEADSYLYPFALVTGRGLTVLDFSSVMDETYRVVFGALKQEGEFCKFDLLKTVVKEQEDKDG